MIKVRDINELRTELLKDKEKYIGKIAVTGNGLKFLIVELTEKKINAIPLDDLIGMKKNEIEKYLVKFFAPDKIESVVAEIQSRRNEINEIYS